MLGKYKVWVKDSRGGQEINMLVVSMPDNPIAKPLTYRVCEWRIEQLLLVRPEESMQY